MTAICNGTDLSELVGYGYKIGREAQITAQVTTLDGVDHSAKIRDRVKIHVPFVALTISQLSSVLQLFPDSSAYVTWRYFDPKLGADRDAQFLFELDDANLMVHYQNGVEYWGGLSVTLTER